MSNGKKWLSAVELEKTLGPEVAGRILARAGGLQGHLPKASALLCALAGPDFEALARAYGGRIVELPRSTSKKSQVLELLHHGEKPDAIARQIGCTTNYIRKLIKQFRG